ncbi:MAG TPA: PFL family protein [Candidatus Ornithospirochaeta avicola]|uniref:UPF0210 protein IAB12_00465 n=1 Tax=Candidatus Ornithospirochaeta avicola TaxID=2840896 RepID=A0A9D1PRB2_9SPIO|nr:PFL family protein [Candidatus Ornithospirochaeta avicola]
MISLKDVIETNTMFEKEKLDVRTITLGLSLLPSVSDDIKRLEKNIYDRITKKAENLIKVSSQIEREYGIPIVNRRISITPLSIVASSAARSTDDYIRLAKVLDRAAENVGVNFLGGFSALPVKGMSKAEELLINSIPYALSETERICSSVNLASSKCGINMSAVALMGKIIKKTSELTKDKDSIGCAKLVVFANAPDDNPFMAGAFHGVTEGDEVINVGVSGPGVIKKVLESARNDDFETLCEKIKKTAFKITRLGQLVATKASERLGIPFGIVDLSLAPTPAIGDSIAEIIEEMGIEKAGAPGTTCALALLNDSVKKGGLMASSSVGGLSGAFIPVSEDEAMIRAAESGSISIEKLEAMTAVCSVGLDMIAISGDISSESISGIIADEMAIGVINNKTTAARLIPAWGKKEGEYINYGGLLGKAPVMRVSPYSSELFIKRGGRIPAPVHSFKN